MDIRYHNYSHHSTQAVQHNVFGIIRILYLKRLIYKHITLSGWQSSCSCLSDFYRALIQWTELWDGEKYIRCCFRISPVTEDGFKLYTTFGPILLSRRKTAPFKRTVWLSAEIYNLSLHNVQFFSWQEVLSASRMKHANGKIFFHGALSISSCINWSSCKH